VNNVQKPLNSETRDVISKVSPLDRIIRELFGGKGKLSCWFGEKKIGNEQQLNGPITSSVPAKGTAIA